MTDIAQTLQERGTRYGCFNTNTKIMQDLKERMRETPNWRLLTAAQKESLDMIAHKIGRILGGDPNYHDSWLDVAGYAKLVADLLENNHVNTKPDSNIPSSD